MNVNNMEWKDLENLVKRRLNKLIMCKRGSLMTDINEQVAKLGKEPTLTDKERTAVKDKLNSKIRKAMTPTLADVKKYNYRELSAVLRDRGQAVEQGAYIHPDRAKWNRAIARLKKQEEERMAQLDGDFQDVEDQFVLQLLKIEDFRAEEERLEAMVW